MSFDETTRIDAKRLEVIRKGFFSINQHIDLWYEFKQRNYREFQFVLQSRAIQTRDWVLDFIRKEFQGKPITKDRLDTLLIGRLGFGDSEKMTIFIYKRCIEFMGFLSDRGFKKIKENKEVQKTLEENKQKISVEELENKLYGEKRD